MQPSRIQYRFAVLFSFKFIFIKFPEKPWIAQIRVFRVQTPVVRQFLPVSPKDFPAVIIVDGYVIDIIVALVVEVIGIDKTEGRVFFIMIPKIESPPAPFGSCSQALT